MASDAYKLGPDALRQLRDAAGEEIFTSIRRGNHDLGLLQELVDVVDDVDRRLASAPPDLLAARQRIFVARDEPLAPSRGHRRHGR